MFFSLILTATQIYGQFVSGSTGVDGAFAPVSNQTIQLPESGIFNYTTVNIPSGVTIKFLPNSQNTPVTILATGNVIITGTISVDGENALTNSIGGKGGPGGARGGTGGFMSDVFAGMSGDGRGGGSGGGGTNGADFTGGGGGGHAVAGTNGADSSASYGSGGVAYGSLSLMPLTGGSGGGGGGGSPTRRGSGGGGGGGAILIASSDTITLNGSITAIGGRASEGWSGGGGGGAGGAIRLIANKLLGNGSTNISGGSTGYFNGGKTGGTGGRGYFRAETYDYTGFNVTSTAPYNIALPSSVVPPNTPQLKITSIGGVTAPLSPKGSLQNAPDMILPGSSSNPVSLQLEAINVPLNTTVEVRVRPTSGSQTVFQSTPLTGSLSSSTATASVNLPDGVSVITVSVMINVQTAQLKPIYINGEKITDIQIASSFGGKSQTVFITKSGKRLEFPTSEK